MDLIAASALIVAVASLWFAYRAHRQAEAWRQLAIRAGDQLDKTTDDAAAWLRLAKARGDKIADLEARLEAEACTAKAA